MYKNLIEEKVKMSFKQEEDESQAIIEAQIASICLLAIVSLICGLVPLLIIRRCNVTNKVMNYTAKSILSGMLCFGGGVLMATSFLHLLPHVREGIDALIECDVILTDLPLTEIIICAGFFMVYLVEEVVHIFADRFARNKTDKSLHRALSVRRCSVSRAPPTEEDECTTEGKHEVVISCNMKNCDQPDPACSDYCEEKSVKISTISHDQLAEKVLPEDYPSSLRKMNGAIVENGRRDSGHSDHSDSHSDHSHQPMSGHRHHHHGIHLHDDSSFGAAIRGLLVIVALSLHEVFEGLAIGLQAHSAKDVWQLFAAVATHKFVIVLCVGLELATTRIRVLVHVVYISILSVITSVGIGIGMGISSLGTDSEDPGLEILILVLQGLCAGTLLYVTFFEILERERSKDISGLLQLALMMIGFMAMLGLESISGHGHSHGHEHDHRAGAHCHRKLAVAAQGLLNSTLQSI
ncbi:zinc transporter ZIP10-like isoform X2 [Artemia franciscana]|uniref:zinc transporter ZIP10-like isoform X2 n=1 Tax=Artemia franciscana TaxID=6661 RepID=UPI0032DB17D8